MSKFKINQDMLREIRNSPKVAADIAARTQRVADAANAEHTNPEHMRNEGYIPIENAGPGETPGRGRVVPGNPHAVRHDARHNTLVRALEAGRG